MRKRADIAAELIYAALTSSKAVSFDGFLEYLDFYADLRASDRAHSTIDEAPCQKPAPLLTLNGRNEYKFDDDEGNAEDASITAPSETSNAPGNEHVFVGKGAAEKREIHDRLLAYREANGIGCLAPLVAAAKGVSQEDLRMMLGSAPVSLAKWLAVGRALEKIEKAAPGADTPETAKEN